MKPSEKGFTLIELLISITIMALATGVAGDAIFQILRNTERNSDHMTVVRQVQNAGYWISRDTEMAIGVTSNLALPVPVLLSLTWTENVASDEPVYHSANYTIENLTGGIGTLKRKHTSSAGANEQIIIAQYIYYNLSDSDNTTKTSYQSPVLTVKLNARFGVIQETREYRIKRRPNTIG